MPPTSWDDERKNLGTVPDSVIAKRMGLTTTTVYQARKRLGIVPVGTTKDGTPDRSVAVRKRHELESVVLSPEHRQLMTDTRIAKGWSQGELAKRAGCNKYTICYIEKGNRPPSPETLSKICKALGLEWDYKVTINVRPRKK